MIHGVSAATDFCQTSAVTGKSSETRGPQDEVDAKMLVSGPHARCELMMKGAKAEYIIHRLLNNMFILSRGCYRATRSLPPPPIITSSRKQQYI